MTTPSLPHAKERTEPAERSQPLRSPAPTIEGFASPILGLQLAAGNQAIGNLLRGSLLQAKLRIGPPGDAYEREADRVAEVVLGEDSAPLPVSVIQGAGIQRMCAECEEEMLQRSESTGEDLVQRQCHCQEEELVQRKCHCQEEEELVQPKADARPTQSAPGLAARVEALRGSGRPLPADVRSFFEPRFGHDFSAVRIHTGASASEAARSVNARAFTVGNDVVFEAGEWSPETTAGKRLLAHELTHVVQQTPLVARRKPLLQRGPEEGGEPSAQTEEEPAISPEEESPTSEEPAPESLAAEGEPSPAVVLDEEAETVGPGQMKKGEFFARLRTEVCAAAEAGLASTEHSARGCPLIQFWLGYYEGQDTERINRDLPRFAGEGPRPTTAEGYISLIAERVRASVTTWARTGEITGVPRGLPLPGMGLPGLGALGGPGGVLFKAKPGGARDPGNPVALQARLGSGRPLEGSIRSRMESAFGRGFSHVRVHNDSGAAGLATSLNAKAFTVGEHVAFGAQEYRPGTLMGDALIAHELAHVAQQDVGGPSTAATGHDMLERDADLAGAGAVASLWGGMRSLPRPEPRLRSGLRLQRCGGCNRKQAATTPAAAGPQAVCAPQPASFETLQAEAPVEQKHTLGYTGLAPTSQHDCTPQFAAGTAPGTCSFTPRPTGLKMISKYVKEGTYSDPQNRTQPVKQCGDVPVKYRVTETISDLAKQGEEEHCKDVQIAFDRTIKPCSDALARLAGTPLTGNTGEQCLGDLAQKLGFHPRNCSNEFIRLYNETLKRDDKNHQWHTFEIPSSPATADCQQVVYQFRKGRKNRIGDPAVKPELHMPPATGCSGTPSPSAPGNPAPAPATTTPPGRALGSEALQEPSDDDAGGRDRAPQEEESPVPEEPASEDETAAVLVVDDDAETVGPGQMKKSEFFARLRPKVRAAAEEALAGTEQSERASTVIELWLGSYEEQDIERINRDLPRFAGEGPRPASAEEYIDLIASRVRISAETWARTGEITGVPEGISLPGLGPPGLGLLGGLLGGLDGMLGSLGRVLFKARSGGARDPGDPRALQGRLGAGRPLDGSIRSRMESAFGRSFSHVRVHADSAAAGLATSLNAKAFTVGEHVAFGAQEYRPGTLIGDALIAHELAHVTQQADGGERFAPLDDRGAEYDALELDADRAAAGAVLSIWGGPRTEARPEPRQRSRLRLSRCECCNKERRPDIKSFNAVKGPEPAMSVWSGEPWGETWRKCRLALGIQGGASGMSFAPEGEMPSDGCSGELQFLQLIDSCREKREPSGSSMRRKTGGYVLDRVDPYPGNFTTVSPGSRIATYTNDNPGLDTPGFDQLSIDDKFKMWLLWKPDEPPGAPRVPLWIVEWSWKAKATRTGNSGDCAGDWTISEAEALGGTGAPTNTMPAWSQNGKDIPWEPGTC